MSIQHVLPETFPHQALLQSIASPLKELPKSLTASIEDQNTGNTRMYSDRGEEGRRKMSSFMRSVERTSIALSEAIKDYGELTAEERDQTGVNLARSFAGSRLARIAQQINPLENQTLNVEPQEAEGLREMANSLKDISRVIATGTPAVLATYKEAVPPVLVS